jgi:hypothetical protein
VAHLVGGELIGFICALVAHKLTSSYKFNGMTSEVKYMGKPRKLSFASADSNRHDLYVDYDSINMDTLA